MISKHWKLLTFTSLVIVLPMVAGLLLWNQLPDQLPSHWNGAGEIDGWFSKTMSVFGTPLFLLVVHWLAIIATFSDPKKNHHSDKILPLVFWMIPLLSVGIHAVIYMTALGKEVNVSTLVPAFMGFLFIIIGNYLPKCKQNYTIGIKIPWTLDSEANWNKTHRFAGKVWVICGMIMVVLSFFGDAKSVLPVALVMVLVPVAYSYLLYRKETTNKEVLH